MPGINLLPSDFGAKSPVARVARTIKYISLIGFVVFLAITVIFLGIFLVNSASLSASLARQEALKNSIESLQQSEQALVLVHDRASKGKSVLEKDKASATINNVISLSLDTRAEVAPSSTQIEREKSEINLLASSFSSLSQFLTDVISGNWYQRIDLDSFSFTPLSGYLVGLKTINK